jgi:hypothetical protein
MRRPSGRRFYGRKKSPAGADRRTVHTQRSQRHLDARSSLDKGELSGPATHGKLLSQNLGQSL